MKTKRQDKTITEYLLFMISHKEVTGQGYKNRTASDYYRLIKQDAIRYNCTVMNIIRQNAYFVMKGEFISLLTNN